jgi:hypothetical protein
LIDNTSKSPNGSPTHKSPPKPNPFTQSPQPAPQPAPIPTQPTTQLKIPNGSNKDLSKHDLTNGKDKDNKDKDITDIKESPKGLSPKFPLKGLAPIEAKDTKDAKDNKESKDNKDAIKPQPLIEKPSAAPAKPTPIPSKAPPVLGSLSGLAKLGGLPSLQPLTKTPSKEKETTFRHALDSDEESDHDLLHDDDDLDDLLDEDKLRKSLSDLDSLGSDHDEPKKGNGREPIKKPAADLSDMDSFHSDDDELYNKNDNPLQKRNPILDSPRSGSDDEPYGKRATNGHHSGSEGEDYNDEFLEEVEEEEGGQSG